MPRGRCCAMSSGRPRPIWRRAGKDRLMSLTIRLNGETRAVAVATVAELVAELATTLRLDPSGRGLAVARNGAVVPRSNWGDTRLAPDDRVEVVRSKQGG